MSEETQFEEEYFLEGHFTGGYELLARLNRWRLRKFGKIIKFYATDKRTKQRTHKSLLDVGCGFGHFLEVLKDDFDVCGTDISNFGVKVTQYKVRCPVEQGNCLEGLPSVEEGQLPVVTKLDPLLIGHTERLAGSTEDTCIGIVDHHSFGIRPVNLVPMGDCLRRTHLFAGQTPDAFLRIVLGLSPEARIRRMRDSRKL